MLFPGSEQNRAVMRKIRCGFVANMLPILAVPLAVPSETSLSLPFGRKPVTKPFLAVFETWFLSHECSLLLLVTCSPGVSGELDLRIAIRFQFIFNCLLF